MSLRCGERWPVSDSGQGEHRCPRSREGTHPDHISCVRNTETPSRSDPPCRRAGKPTVRKAQFLGGNRMTKKRTPAAETQQETEIGWPAPFQLEIPDNWPDTGPHARARKRADVVR
jgi:hypothetical protein